MWIFMRPTYIDDNGRADEGRSLTHTVISVDWQLNKCDMNHRERVTLSTDVTAGRSRGQARAADSPEGREGEVCQPWTRWPSLTAPKIPEDSSVVHALRPHDDYSNYCCHGRLALPISTSDMGSSSFWLELFFGQRVARFLPELREMFLCKKRDVSVCMERERGWSDTWIQVDTL